VCVCDRGWSRENEQSLALVYTELYSLPTHDYLDNCVLDNRALIIGLFCRISSLLKGSFAKETYHFEEPTNRNHPIENEKESDGEESRSILLYQKSGTDNCR